MFLHTIYGQGGSSPALSFKLHCPGPRPPFLISLNNPILCNFPFKYLGLEPIYDWLGPPTPRLFATFRMDDSGCILATCRAVQ